MGVFNYLFNVSFEQKKQDWKEYQKLKRAVRYADSLVDKARDKIHYPCKEHEDLERVHNKCFVSKIDTIDCSYEPCDKPFIMKRYCEKFRDCVRCDTMMCPSVSDNHRYVDAVLYLQELETQKREFWDNKFAKVK